MTDIFYKALSTALEELNISVPENTFDKFARCAELLTEYGKKVNLTAITDEADIAVKHFADSLAVLKYVDIKNSSSVIDVGTGAGFPGIPLLIARPDLSLTLIDSTNKKLQFVREACEEIKLTPKIVHIRAEDAGKSPLFREKYDLVVSRAVADLRILAEYCLPLTKIGGHFAAHKGDVNKELNESQNAIYTLSGKTQSLFKYELSGNMKRSIIVIKKLSQTSPKYPRTSTQISKFPL